METLEAYTVHLKAEGFTPSPKIRDQGNDEPTGDE
jgi:hypothetical protein